MSKIYLNREQEKVTEWAWIDEEEAENSVRLYKENNIQIDNGFGGAVVLFDSDIPHLINALQYAQKAIKEKNQSKTDSSDGWIEWEGGACPVVPSQNVQAWLRSQEEAPEEEGFTDKACNWVWEWNTQYPEDDIIKYRVV